MTATMTTAMTVTTTPSDVLLFIPNLIGYFRVICTLTSLTLMICVPSTWLLAILLYLSSFILDLFDGMAARKLNQTSSFGGLLDMITDRCSTLGLLYVLGTETSTPLFRLGFLMLIILDISSHWCQQFSTTALQPTAHHKSEASNAGRFFLVQWYYKYYWFFGYLCVGAEVFWICRYSMVHVDPSSALSVLVHVLAAVFAPGCVMKQIINVFQLTSACHAVASYDAKEAVQSSKKAF
jgi:CDP-diacylglycerol--inositol 3-phosphatidyltransferase